MSTAEPPVTQHASHRVFDISELLDLICSFLGEKHCGGLMRASRQFYHSTLAMVWRDVDLTSLLLLIPGTSIRNVDSDDDLLMSDNEGGGFSMKLKFPAQFDWTRFEVYAPFVKHLRAGSLRANREPLDYPTHILLPNLQHVSSTVLGFHCLKRLGLFPRIFSTTLLSYRLIVSDEEGFPWLDQDSCFDLMSGLSLSCPRLQTLAVFPEVYAEGPPTRLGRFYSYLLKMPNLRSLTCCGWMLHHESALQRIGQLPLLEELALALDASPDPVPFDLRSSMVSEESFPTLRHLDIEHLDPPSISYLCALKPLVRNITKLRVTYAYFYEDPSDDEMSEEDRSGNLILSLAQTSPQLTDLKLRTRGDYGVVYISTPVLDVFKALHLVRLDLGFIEFRFQVRWEHFVDALPHLQELHLGQQPLAFRRLRKLAHALPDLRLLALRSLLFGPPDLSSSMAIHEPHGERLQPIVIQATFHSRDGAPGKIHYIAGYLHELWPNCVWEPQASDSEKEKLESDKLNRVISILRSQHKG